MDDFGSLELRWTGDGRLAGMFYRDRRAIFEYEGDPLPALQRWTRAHAQELGLAADEQEPLELELDRTIELEAGLVIHRYVQRHRGYRIAGPDEVVSLTSVDGAVISIVGAFSDNRVEYTGSERPLDREQATRRVLAHAGPDAQLGSLSLVALSERQTLAWLAHVERAEGPVELALAADTGELLFERSLAAQSPFDHYPITVVAKELGANPASTTTTSFPGQPGSSWTGSWNSTYGWLLRMGDERMAAYDFELTNHDAIVRLTTQLYWGTNVSYSTFAAQPNTDALAFNTQDMFHKASVGLDELDARQQVFGWDHPASTGFGAFTPAPVSLFTNPATISESGQTCTANADCLSNDCDSGYCRCTSQAQCGVDRKCVPEPWAMPGTGNVCRKPDPCRGAGGVFTFTDSSNPALQTPYSNKPTSNVFACDDKASTLYHELGHYVDYHATTGMLGSGLAGNSCVLGTTDEAIPLRETLGEIVSLYLLHRLYPTGYTLSQADQPCSFADLGQGVHSIHHHTCINDPLQLGWYPDDQQDFLPAAGAGNPCVYHQGYRVRSVSQAVWAWLNRRVCMTVSPYACGTFSLAGDGVEFMDGMLYALNLSNLQSYEMFFENIETYLWATKGQAIADTFRDVMSRYGILAP